MKIHTFKKGFTLVELLIVIALLGALAVGLLAALDPFEQLKKGTDTGTRNTVSEIQGAIIRYYAIKNAMPWDPDTTIGPINANGTGYSTLGLDKIVAAGELKTDFSSLGQPQLPRITVIGTDTSATVCYKPDSKAFRSDPNTKFDATGKEGSTCPDPSVANFSCFWCVK